MIFEEFRDAARARKSEGSNILKVLQLKKSLITTIYSSCYVEAGVEIGQWFERGL